MKKSGFLRRLQAGFLTGLLIFGSTPQAGALSRIPVDGAALLRSHTYTSDLRLRGQSYKLFTTTDARGRITRQILSGKNRTEIFSDKHGWGRLDSWDLITPDASVSMSAPARGAFREMRIQRRYPRGTVTLNFLRDPKRGDFRGESFSVDRFKVLRDDEFIAGCNSTNPSLLNTGQELNAFIANDPTKVGALIQKSVMDKSCDSATYAQSKQLILKALEAIANSDNGSNKQNPGSYLQCLRHFDMDVHANRIANAFVEAVHGVYNPAWTWTLSCGLDRNDGILSTLAADKDHPALATYNQVDHQLRVYMTPAQMRADEAPKTLSDPQVQNIYNNVLFHELLHYSGITDEPETFAVANCCAAVDGPARTAACNNLKKLIDAKKDEEGVKFALMNKFPDFDQFMQNLSMTLGQGASPALNEYFYHAGQIVAQYSAMPECQPKNPKFTKTCVRNFYKALGDMTYKDFFAGGDQSQCFRLAADNIGADNARKFCAKFEIQAGNLFHIFYGEAGKVKLCPEKIPHSSLNGAPAGADFVALLLSFLRERAALADGQYGSSLMGQVVQCDADDTISMEQFMDGRQEVETGVADSNNNVPTPGVQLGDIAAESGEVGDIVSGAQLGDLSGAAGADGGNAKVDIDPNASAQNTKLPPATGPHIMSPGPELGDNAGRSGAVTGGGVKVADGGAAAGSGGAPPSTGDGGGSTTLTGAGNSSRSDGRASSGEGNWQQQAGNGSSMGEDSPQPPQKTFDRPPPEGPTRPIFSNDSQERQQAIEDHLSQSDSLLSRTKDAADTIAQALVPQAHADTDAVAASEKVYINPAKLPIYNAKLESLSLPDPFLGGATGGAGGLTNSGAANGRGAASASSSTRSAPAWRGSSPPTAKESSPLSAARATASAGFGSRAASGGGFSAPVARAAARSSAGKTAGLDKKRGDETPGETEALGHIFKFLQQPYKNLRGRLSEPVVVSALVEHRILVTDDQGKLHGSLHPRYYFLYNRKLDRLVPERRQ